MHTATTELPDGGTANEPTDVEVVIVGSGFSGIGAAIKLREAGVREIAILERGDSIGGTWRDNHYPGAACDIPAHLYSFSFAPKTDWSTHYPRQPEIRAYLEQLADDFDVRRHVVLDTTVASMVYDEDRATWTVTSADGRAWRGRAAINASGLLADPGYPAIPGREDFAGPQFHSATWDHDVDLDGKRIGVVGTGASAIQFVPHLTERASELVLFQRSAPWVLPRGDRSYTDVEKTLFEKVPGARWLWRQLIYWQKELRFPAFSKGNPAMRLMEKVATKHMEHHVADPAKREALTPDYRMGCKRILIHNEFYPAVAQDHVTIETTRIREVTADGVLLDDGREMELDVLVWGTGFAVDDPLGGVEIRGRDGRDLAEEWDPHPYALKGTTVPGFPNLFFMTGPNTGLGHNSMLHIMESQFPYVVEAISHVTSGRAVAIEPREDVTREYQQELTDRLDGRVWASGCESWYLGEDGHNFTLWPGSTVGFRQQLRSLDLDEMVITRPHELPDVEREDADVPA